MRAKCIECGLYCKPYDEFIRYGCKDYDSPEPLDPEYICKKCFPQVKAGWIKNFKEGGRYGNWQKSRAEMEAAEECGLKYVWSGGVGELGTKDFASAHQYISKEEYDRLEKLPYWGYCKVCGAIRKGGYCSDKNCKNSFYAKYGHEPI